MQLGQWQIDGDRDADAGGLIFGIAHRRWRSRHDHRRPRAPPAAGACRPRSSAARPSWCRRRPRSSCAATAPSHRGVGADGRRAHPEAHRRRRAPGRDGRAGRRPAVGQRLAEPLLPVGARGPRGVGGDGGEPSRSPNTSRRHPIGSSASGSCRCSIPSASSSASTTRSSAAGSPASRSRRSPGDVELSDARLEPFWARAAELGCRRVPAPVRLQPRRAARPLLPLQHGGPAGRERRRAVAPDLRGSARPASRT